MAAVVTWIFADRSLAIALGVFAVFFTLAALRCAQVAFIRPQIEDSIDPGETILATLGGRNRARFGIFRSPTLVVLSDRHLYSFRVGLKAEPPLLRVPGSDVLGVAWNGETRTVGIRLPNTTLELVGVNPEEVEHFQAVIHPSRSRTL